MALLSRFEVPRDGLGMVLTHTTSNIIQHSEIGLSLRVALLSSSMIPFRCFNKILGRPQAILKHHTKVILRGNITSISLGHRLVEIQREHKIQMRHAQSKPSQSFTTQMLVKTPAKGNQQPYGAQITGVSLGYHLPAQGFSTKYSWLPKQEQIQQNSNHPMTSS